jgi:hypothetical protein
MVEDSGYLARLIAYIHLNPVIAKVAEDPAMYRNSGHRELLGKVNGPLIHVDEVLAEYGDSLRSARRAYVRSLRAERESEWIGDEPGRLPWWKRERDRPLEPTSPETWVDEQGRSTGLERAPLSAEDYLRRACLALGVEPARVGGAGQDREVSRIRYLVAALGVERWGVRAKALGDLFGRRPEVVTRWVARGAERRQRDGKFLADYTELDKVLAAGLKGKKG